MPPSSVVIWKPWPVSKGERIPFPAQATLLRSWGARTLEPAQDSSSVKLLLTASDTHERHLVKRWPCFEPIRYDQVLIGITS